MNNITALLPERLKTEFLDYQVIDNLSTNSNLKDFIEFKLLKSDFNNYVLIVHNFSKRTFNTVISETLNVLCDILKNDISLEGCFILESNTLTPLNRYILNLSTSPKKYSPDFAYILDELASNQDETFRKEVKLKIFSELMKFVIEDEELYSLAKSIILMKK